jgi:release factor glutamine methyltransferase
VCTMDNAALARQARKIDEFRKLSKPYKKHIAGLQLTVLPDVYPAGTDSVLLSETMIIRKGDTVLDVCTGNGIVALVAAQKGAQRVLGTDLNPAAVRNAKLNRDQLGLQHVEFVEADLFPKEGEQFDVITANVPYSDSPAPDKTAICFWDEDHAVLRAFFKDLRRYLKPTGSAFLTWASFAEPDLPASLAAEHNVEIHLAGSCKSEKSGFEYYVYRLTLAS